MFHLFSAWFEFVMCAHRLFFSAVCKIMFCLTKYSWLLNNGCFYCVDVSHSLLCVWSSLELWFFFQCAVSHFDGLFTVWRKNIWQQDFKLKQVQPVSIEMVHWWFISWVKCPCVFRGLVADPESVYFYGKSVHELRFDWLLCPIVKRVNSSADFSQDIVTPK